MPVIVVDDRMFLLGLDMRYRGAMKRFETSRLLPCAARVAEVLGVGEVDAPVEGYYAETPELTRYLRLMRALQLQPQERSQAVRHMPEFQLLLAVATAPVYGRVSGRNDPLLPQPEDPLTKALECRPLAEWAVAPLVEDAYAVAMEWDDFSLVGLAARIREPIVLTAVRESVILYAGRHLGGGPEYRWAVDERLAAAANRFIEVFNAFVPGALPRAEPASAAAEAKYNIVEGRCACIGDVPSHTPRYYHWAIRATETQLTVDDFWSSEIWTTQRYRSEKGQIAPGTGRAPSSSATAS